MRKDRSSASLSPIRNALPYSMRNPPPKHNCANHSHHPKGTLQDYKSQLTLLKKDNRNLRSQNTLLRSRKPSQKTLHTIDSDQFEPGDSMYRQDLVETQAALIDELKKQEIVQQQLLQKNSEMQQLNFNRSQLEVENEQLRKSSLQTPHAQHLQATSTSVNTYQTTQPSNHLQTIQSSVNAFHSATPASNLQPISAQFTNVQTTAPSSHMVQQLAPIQQESKIIHMVNKKMQVEDFNRNELVQTKDELLQMQTKYILISEEFKALQESHEETLEELDATKKEFKESRKEFELTKENLSTVQALLNQTQTDFDDSRSQVTDLESTNATLSRAASFQAELNILKQKYAKKKEIIIALRESEQYLSEKLQSTQARIDEDEISKLQITISRLNLELTDYKLKLNRTIEDAKAREQELLLTHDFHIQNEIDGLKKRLNDLQKRLRIAEAKHVEDQELLNNADLKIQNLEYEVNAREKQAQRAEAELSHYRDADSDNQRTMTTKSAEMNSIKRSNELLRQEIVDLKKDLLLLKTDADHINNGRRLREHDYNMKMTEMKQMHTENEGLKSKIVELNQEIFRLKNRLPSAYTQPK